MEENNLGNAHKVHTFKGYLNGLFANNKVLTRPFTKEESLLIPRRSDQLFSVRLQTRMDNC